ncbi:hypothetical protein CH253_27025 [Rhodococcus sp. 06-156-3C]|uniref:hypothetical protein n=1 Tax=Nocardiaceae TaxID=85025 RepID=UPI000522E5BE|nr:MULTISPECIES: hypothetical protein [Rhodococcus]OZD12333.1 hypothetical protein CH253_27025 [Rhodococcus sp. 06-156-3C]OZD19001.1 hypothetical protein CH280_04830 [Rhodococcus sp. 06-156-4C]OZD20960.1 hypothetical protein CH248_11900 [Rhodococcus sp. 06-156-4a]OZD29135.1 hypothetical protein CH247_19495 [Rhodococcus sp. 06-156-3b]OZD33690.1 hypothetical protein CH284_18965 [Rhodococcus sp. 06-156-3]
MRSPAASLRGGAVGATTVSLSVAAHGWADGGYPSGSAAVLVLIVGLGIGAVSAVPRSGRATVPLLLAGMVLGQFASHVALVVGDPHAMMHGHTILPSPAMTAFHVAASALAAVLVCAAERLYGPITAVVRSVLDPPQRLAVPPGLAVEIASPLPRAPFEFTTSISRRGPPTPA